MFQNKVTLTPQDILEKEFKIDTRGYRLKEVDQFLDINNIDYFYANVNTLLYLFRPNGRIIYILLLISAYFYILFSKLLLTLFITNIPIRWNISNELCSHWDHTILRIR